MTVFIKTRPSKKGDRHSVRWRKGRNGKEVQLGVYGSMPAAEKAKRRAQVQEDNGEIPTPIQVRTLPVKRTIAGIAQEWINAGKGSRSDALLLSQKSSVKAITDYALGGLDPAKVTAADVQAWIHELIARPLMPDTIRLKKGHLAQLLDWAEIDPNPVRSKRVERPRVERPEYYLPTRRQLDQIEAAFRKPIYGTLMRFLEHSGVRCSEMVALTNEHVRHDRGRFFVVKSKTNAGVRWVDVLDGHPLILPVADEGAHGSTRAFPQRGVSVNNMQVVMQRACLDAGITRDGKPYYFTPHILRHLHISRLHDEGWSWARIADRVGHASPQITADRYSHLIPPEED